jgi:DNA-binding LacI/PurR family transcriptional regulator
MGFKGVGLFACPVPSLNTELYHELRAEGIKVALLSAHQYDVSQETVFLPNHNQGGYLAVEEMYARGARSFVYVGSRDFAVYKDWIAEGARRAAHELGAAYTEWRDGVKLEVDEPTVSGRPVREWMQTLEPETAVLADAAYRAAMLENVRMQLPPALKEEIHVVSCGCDPTPLCPDIPRIEYDVPGLLEETVEYLADDDIDPQLVVHRWYQPVFVPGSQEEDD